jgi:hypothetical protein
LRLNALLGQHPVAHWSLVYDITFRVEKRLNLHFFGQRPAFLDSHLWICALGIEIRAYGLDESRRHGCSL